MTETNWPEPGVALTPEFERLQEPGYRQAVVDQFHYLYYHQENRTWTNTNWLGVPVSKCPLDLWVYQEILAEVRPDVIIECGTFRGGSALYLASVCELLDHGRVYTIDVDARPELPLHPRIEYVAGSSTSDVVADYLRSHIAPEESVLVILDSDHSRDHVLAELDRFSGFVTPGSYIVVEDTNVNGHPVYPDHGPGPMEALTDFLAAHHQEFVVDEEREKFFLTFNPRGYLRFLGRRPASAAVARLSSSASAAGAPDRRHRYDFDRGRERDTAHARLLRLVGDGKRVLDIGCAGGMLARHLAEQRCSVVGIEGDSVVAAEAARFCERVILSDLASSDWEHQLGSDRFDVVTAADVLEHLPDPGACLRQLRRFVRPGGVVVASIPNVAHGSLRLALLSGEFEYRDLGLLDRTHLRFFTRQTVEQLFDEAGYVVKTLERIELPLTGTEIPVPEDTPAGLVDWLNADEESRTYQFVVVAAPLRHGSEGLRQRARELAAENLDLRQRLRSLTRPLDVAPHDDSEIVDDGLRRRMLQFRAAVLDLRRQLAQRQALLERVQADLLARLARSEPLESVLKAREAEIQQLNEYVRRQVEESTRYAASLNEALAHKDDELGRLRAEVAASTAFLKEHSREAERCTAALDEALSRKDDELRQLLAERQSLGAELAEAREDLRIHRGESDRYAACLVDALARKDDELRRLLEDRQAVAAERSALAEQLRTQTSEAERYAASLDEALSRKDDELRQLLAEQQARAAERSALAGQLRTQMSEAERYAASLNEALSRKDDELRQLLAEQQARGEQLAVASEELRIHRSESDRHAACLVGALSRKDDELRLLLEDRQAVAAERSALAEQLRTQMSEAERYTSSLEEALARKDGELRQLQALAASLRQQSQEAAAEFQVRGDETAARLEAARREIEKIHSGWTWRLASFYWRGLDRARRLTGRRPPS